MIARTWPPLHRGLLALVLGAAAGLGGAAQEALRLVLGGDRGGARVLGASACEPRAANRRLGGLWWGTRAAV